MDTQRKWYWITGARRLHVAALLSLCAVLHAGTSGAQVIGGGTGEAGRGSVVPAYAQARLLDSPPAISPEAQAACIKHANLPIDVPAGPTRGVAAPENPPTEPPGGTEPSAPTDYVLRRSTGLGGLSAAGASFSQINEPSVGSINHFVFYTGNWYAAISSDGGNTFSYVNPYSMFPDPATGGFCCDQSVTVAPAQNMLLWLLQYTNNADGNVQRIAVAAGDANIGNQSWTYYDFNAQNFGFPAGAWLDYPSLTTSSTNLYATSNVFTVADSYLGSVTWRIGLADLADGGAVSYLYIVRTDGTLRCTEGAQATMYIAENLNSTTERIFKWADASGSYDWVDTAIGAYNSLNRDGLATSPDGTNWAGRADSRPLAATVSGGLIGVMFCANTTAGRTYPYVRISYFKESDRSLDHEADVFSGSVAWLYPSASVNAAGAIGGTIAYGGGTYYPSTGIWINDDVSASLPGSIFSGNSGTGGPSGNVWGDYLTAHPHGTFQKTWTATGYSIQPGGIVPNYFWFGRERDMPPINDNFVDATVISGINGTAAGNNLNASKEPGEPNHAGYAGSTTAWWTWTAPATALANFNTGGSGIDTLLGVYTGSSVDALTLVAANDDCSGAELTSCVSFNAIRGETYRIAVAGFLGTQGAIALNWSMAPPVNDNCSGATVVSDGTTFGDTATATTDGASSCGTSETSPDVWFAYTAPPNVCSATFSLCGSGFDTALSVHSACPGTLANQLFCNDDYCGLQSEITLSVSSGSTYFLRVTGFAGAAGPFTLKVASYLCNDACTSAQVVETGGTYNGDTTLATADGIASCAPVTSPDVWFVYTPEPGTCTANFSLCGSAMDTVIAVYSDCPGTADHQLACNDDYCGLQSNLDLPVTEGKPYYIRVSGYGGGTGPFTLNVTGTACTPTPTPTPAPGREVGDFDNSGCTNIVDFLFLLDYWQTVSPIGAPVLGITDFLALLDNWNLGPTCP